MSTKYPIISVVGSSGAGTSTVKDTFENISVYADIIDQIKNDVAAYEEYYILPGERPDQVSLKLYDTPNYHWTFFLLNDDIKEQGWPLSNKNLFKTYHGYSDVEMPNKEKINSFVERVKAVYIDSSINGILKSRELKKNILSLDSELNQKKKNFDTDSPFQSEDYTNNLRRRKKRIEKKLNRVPLIQIKILTR